MSLPMYVDDPNQLWLHLPPMWRVLAYVRAHPQSQCHWEDIMVACDATYVEIQQAENLGYLYPGGLTVNGAEAITGEIHKYYYQRGRQAVDKERAMTHRQAAEDRQRWDELAAYRKREEELQKIVDKWHNRDRVDVGARVILCDLLEILTREPIG